MAQNRLRAGKSLRGDRTAYVKVLITYDPAKRAQTLAERGLEIASSFGGRFQREKIPGGGASGKGVRNRIEAGGADCPSVSSGLVDSGDAKIGGFFGGSTTLCGRCSLRADLSCFLDFLFASFFAGFSGGTTGVASGKSSANAPRPLGSFSDSTHRRMVSLSSSIAAHPARPKVADRAIKTSATRAQARINILAIPVVAGGGEGGTVWLPRG
jgi:hypothetical protein